MKTILKIILFTLYFTNLSAQTYVVEDQTVYYYDKVITGADANSFDVLYENKYFSKDKNNIYYKGAKTNYDANTFEIHGNGDRYNEQISDKNDVYVKSDVGYIGIGSMSPKDFNLITEKIGIDNEIIYWEFNSIFGSNASTFQIVNSTMFKDKNYVYNEGYKTPIRPKNITLFKRKDIDRIEFIGDQNMICDNNNHCYQMDASSFEYINYNYTKDKSNVLCRTNYLKADVATFEVPIPNVQHYAKDKFHQFYLGETFPIKVDERHIKPDNLRAFKLKLEKQLEKAFENEEVQYKYDKDTKASLSTLYTFPNSNNTIIEKGKNVYMNGLRQPFIDAESFEVFTNDYAKDKNQVYLIYEYDDKVTFNPVNEIDPATFSIIKNDYDAYCKDAKNVYHTYKKIIDADPNTFKVLSEYHTEDKNAIFYEGDKIHSIKPLKETLLKIIEDNYLSFGNKIIYINYSGFDILVDNPNLNHFKVINDSYAINGNQLIYKGKTIATLDLQETIIKEDNDKIVTSMNRIFEYGQNISTPKERKLYKYLDSKYSTDGHTLYYKDLFEIKGVDLANINHSGTYVRYFTFKNNKALYDNIVFDIDLESFEGLNSLHYARDKNFVYYDGKKTTLDPSTFFIHGNNYTSDKNGVYYNEKLIPEADSKSFYVFNRYGFDDTYFYHYNKKILRSKVNFKL
ncbi:DKNYY domain-containing protein [Aureibaculum sp. A20]|uniref:DKNYY domain-containing protein n=1 Tax=Aureibaculum flavum TaxID=2795986 RepID=A0ABS0WVB2_9FLAO|nr:DKNYY domain-containing protein [Aureibaculum flavum]MBJ2175851.1 DKNYY domain-containing protein [Aureibaculum flavum]